MKYRRRANLSSIPFFFLLGRSPQTVGQGGPEPVRDAEFPHPASFCVPPPREVLYVQTLPFLVPSCHFS